jgi:hypothetical protein
MADVDTVQGKVPQGRAAARGIYYTAAHRRDTQYRYRRNRARTDCAMGLLARRL